MENPYSKYKQRLFSKIQENPELRLMNKAIAQTAMPFQELNNQLQSSLQMGNASPGAKVAATLRGQQQLQDERQQMYGQAVDAMQNRTGQLEDKLGEVMMKEEEWRQAEIEQKAAKRTAALRTGLQIAGMVIGTIATAGVGGMGILAGMGIGGGIGQMVGGVTGIDKDGNLSVDPENFDTEAIIQGAVGAASTYSQYANEKQMKSVMATVTQKLSSPEVMAAFDKMKPEQVVLYGTMLQNAINSGDMEAATALFDGMAGAGSPTSAGMDVDTDMAGVTARANAAFNTAAQGVVATRTRITPAATPAAQNTQTKAATVGQDTLIQSLTSQNAKKAYIAMANTLYTDYNGDPNSPEFKAWVASKNYKAGTYNKFLRYYNAAMGTQGATTDAVTPTAAPSQRAIPSQDHLQSKPVSTSPAAADNGVAKPATISLDRKRDVLQPIQGHMSRSTYPSDDYDYAAWEKDNPGKSWVAHMNSGEHFPDTYKLPNHITFSSDSKYSNDKTQGGTWEKIHGTWHFTPSEYNLSQHHMGEYKTYFSKKEPDAVLELPVYTGSDPKVFLRSAGGGDELTQTANIEIGYGERVAKKMREINYSSAKTLSARDREKLDKIIAEEKDFMILYGKERDKNASLPAPTHLAVRILDADYSLPYAARTYVKDELDRIIKERDAMFARKSKYDDEMERQRLWDEVVEKAEAYRRERDK